MKYLAVKVAGCISFFLTKKFCLFSFPNMEKVNKRFVFELLNRENYYCSRILLTKNAQKTKQKKRDFFYEFLFINQERESGNFRKLKITKKKKN